MGAGETAVVIQQGIASGDIALPAALKPVFAACDAIPNYRSFIAQRQKARRKPLAALANLDLDAALQALEEWMVRPQTQEAQV